MSRRLILFFVLQHFFKNIYSKNEQLKKVSLEMN